jgi:hypothetical protein
MINSPFTNGQKEAKSVLLTNVDVEQMNNELDMTNGPKVNSVPRCVARSQA